jgi:PAS domain S-box-containing protein
MGRGWRNPGQAYSGGGEDMRGLVSEQWRKIESRIGSFFIGRNAATDENPRIRFFLYSVIISIILLGSFFLHDLGTISAYRSMLTALAGIGQVVSLIVLRHVANPRSAFRVSTLVLLSYFLFLVEVGGPHGTRLFWMLIFPVYAFLLFGGREGLLWTAAGFFGSAYVLFDPYSILATFPYENEVKVRFLIIYAVLGAVARVFESITYRPQEDIARQRTAELEEVVQRLSKEIEERTHIQAELILSEQRFRTLSDASFEGIAVTEGGLFIDLNDQLARMFGYDRSEMIGMPVMKCVVPEHRELVDDAIRSGKVGPYEHMAMRKDGSFFPVQIQPRVSDVGGWMLRITAIRDISKRKKAEKEIREARDFAEAVLASLPGTFFVFDEQLRLTRWNNNFLEVGGYTEEELHGKHPLEMIDEKERDVVGKKIDEILLHGSGSLEATTLTKGGGRISFLFNVVSRTIGAARYFVGTGIDISYRKRAEERLRRSEELFRLAFDIGPDAVAITKVENGIFVDVNSSFSEVFGYSKDDAIGRSSLELHIWPDPQTRETMVADLAQKGFVRNLEARFRTREGRLITGLFSGSSFILNGEPHILSVIKDITELPIELAQQSC